VTEEPKFDDIVKIKLNLGSLIHKHYRLDGATHELKLTWNGITGSLDVYVPETGELLDLKSIWTPSTYIKELPYIHHARQIEYYCLLLAKNNLRVGPATVLYVPINVAKTIEVRPISEVEAEVAAKVKAVKQAQESKIPPLGLLKSRECNYCPFLRLCDEVEKAKEAASS
jgi:CRISPR/Cas system-associated exonuclease Cas4 (RecB family)